MYSLLHLGGAGLLSEDSGGNYGLLTIFSHWSCAHLSVFMYFFPHLAKQNCFQMFNHSHIKLTSCFKGGMLTLENILCN